MSIILGAKHVLTIGLSIDDPRGFADAIEPGSEHLDD